MKLDAIMERAIQLPRQKVAVAAAEDPEVIEAVASAVKMGLADFLLFGNAEKIIELLRNNHHDLAVDERVRVIHTGEKATSAEQAVRAIISKEATVLMKGDIQTAAILKAVLNKEYGLRTGRVLSHVGVFEVPGYDRLILVTDAGMNITPDLEHKAQIAINAIETAKALGIENPKVAPIAALETINPAMAATVDAAALTQMNRRGQIAGCVIDGPLALDNAVSSIAAAHKGIKSEVAGQADILLVPTIEVGNALYKSLVYFAKAKVGGVIAGAAAPIVLTSRADTAESKLYSLALALCFDSK
ncbi:phosphate butyryltransferase [Bacillus sp. T33-2]|uniref:phosphate butyryltransferase n=1 Tax=Bacillus sp. T33-2 TaxID=2054168 RepID=UPI000C779776|nr:phosphate butyryltransferase [Bacillus sp. T33-2]PLR99864.1 phosphate butyryltransferase [Bacillus sp. T33-2]